LSSGLVRGGTLTVERRAIRLSVVELTVLQEFVQTANRLFLVLCQPWGDLRFAAALRYRR